MQTSHWLICVGLDSGKGIWGKMCDNWEQRGDACEKLWEQH
jgi:hypothetical protein